MYSSAIVVLWLSSTYVIHFADSMSLNFMPWVVWNAVTTETTGFIAALVIITAVQAEKKKGWIGCCSSYITVVTAEAIDLFTDLVMSLLFYYYFHWFIHYYSTTTVIKLFSVVLLLLIMIYSLLFCHYCHWFIHCYYTTTVIVLFIVVLLLLSLLTLLMLLELSYCPNICNASVIILCQVRLIKIFDIHPLLVTNLPVWDWYIWWLTESVASSLCACKSSLMFYPWVLSI